MWGFLFSALCNLSIRCCKIFFWAFFKFSLCSPGCSLNLYHRYPIQSNAALCLQCKALSDGELPQRFCSKVRSQTQFVAFGKFRVFNEVGICPSSVTCSICADFKDNILFVTSISSSFT